MRRRLLRPGEQSISPLLLPIALAAAAPLTLYAVEMVQLHREAGPNGAFYLGVAATALAVPCVALVAGLRAPGWRLPAWVAGLTLLTLCAASLAAPSGAAAMGIGWALLGCVTAVGFVAAAEWEHRRTPRPAELQLAAG